MQSADVMPVMSKDSKTCAIWLLHITHTRFICARSIVSRCMYIYSYTRTTHHSHVFPLSTATCLVWDHVGMHKRSMCESTTKATAHTPHASQMHTTTKTPTHRRHKTQGMLKPNNRHRYTRTHLRQLGVELRSEVRQQQPHGRDRAFLDLLRAVAVGEKT